MRTTLLALPLLLCACGEDPPTGLDPARIFETRTPARSYQPAPYLAETPTLFRTGDRLPDLDVRALAVSGGRVYAGTGGGLFVLAPGGDHFADVPGVATGTVVDLALLDAGLLVARSAAVERLDGAGLPAETLAVRTASAGARVVAVAAEGSSAYALTTRALERLDASPPLRIGQGELRDLAIAGGVAYVASDRGVLRFTLASGAELPAWRAPGELLDDDVRALALAPGGGELLAGTAQGLSTISLASGSASKRPAGLEGLPTGSVRALAVGSGGTLLGHAVGATLLDGAGVQHYHSLRWIPGEEVRAVAFGSGGELWLGTPAGVSRIAQVETSFAAKEALNESFLQARHWRMDGFVDDDVRFADAWDLEDRAITGDHDNDGLWTEMQIGSWCLAYAVTKDERYYQSARKAMDVMQLQFDVPAASFTAKGMAPGFITRSLVRDDEGEVFQDKASRSNWHLQEFGGRMYYWKDDTSSDEYAGHYWGIPLFYDLCAKSEAEKEELRKRIRWSTDYVIAGNYQLIDLDGMSTSYGHWEDLAAAADGLDRCTTKGYSIDTCVSSYYGGGWLNSLEILGHLLAAWHLTGDQKYYDAYEALYTQQGYGRMVPINEDTWTVTNPRFANHSDHELAMLSYYTLLRYEPNPERRALAVRSILDVYEREREEHNPWQVATIASAHDQEVDLDAAIQVLKDMPSDWREVPFDNSHRLDAMDWPLDRHDNPQFSRVFPYDEIRTMKWNGNPYAKAGGGDARSVLAPTPWLIAYWMMRYHGLIQ